MPIYEYQCTNCGHEFETLQKISEDPLKECPECETASLRKKVSAAGFRLKGGGWYETDFKGNKGKKSSNGGENDQKSSGDGDGASPSASSETASKSNSKSDTKSESKSSASKSDD